ncbi:hypothetical protein AB7M17_006002 [Bradyrhizobium sp. USDA 377]
MIDYATLRVAKLAFSSLSSPAMSHHAARFLFYFIGYVSIAITAGGSAHASQFEKHGGGEPAFQGTLDFLKSRPCKMRRCGTGTTIAAAPKTDARQRRRYARTVTAHGSCRPLKRIHAKPPRGEPCAQSPPKSDPAPSILIVVIAPQSEDGSGKASEPGREGQPGRDGQDGKPGRDGKDGQPGRDGKDGEPGRDGKDGKPGRDGRDGEAGRDGQVSRNGSNTQPVTRARDGKDGRDGRDGRDGKNGRDGKDGKDGKPGRDGKDGQAKCVPLTIKEDCTTTPAACPKLTTTCATPTSTETPTTETPDQPEPPSTTKEDSSMISEPNLLAVGALAAGILFVGLFILLKILKSDQEKHSNIWGERLGQYTLQILGLTFILPTILIIAVATKLNAEAVTALLGSIIGYIFGSSRSDSVPSVLSETQARSTAPAALASPAAPAAPAPETSTTPPNTPPAGGASTGS